MDGKLLYIDFKEGWDAVEAVGPPGRSKPPPGPPKPAAWKWDGHNGNNGLWFGSTKAGVRLELKGEDPLWWAGSPYDSGTSPEPPLSWSNNGSGGINASLNGTAWAYSGPRSMAAGDSISYVFSLMVTPVRPHDPRERFKERWAQLGGASSNYTALAESGVTARPTSIAPGSHCV